MDSCLNCGGAILEPNKIYGYGGKVCFCPRQPGSEFQRPASKEKTFHHPCKETCSGWQQGREVGRAEAQTDIDGAYRQAGQANVASAIQEKELAELRAQLAIAVEALEIAYEKLKTLPWKGGAPLNYCLRRLGGKND